MPTLYLQNSGEYISLGPPLATGGQATIRPVAGHPDLLVKEYTCQTPDIEERLPAMVADPPPCVSLGYGAAELAWPLDVVRDADRSDACVGYVMRHVRGRLPLHDIADPEAFPPGLDVSCRMRMAGNLTWMIRELHAAGYIVGDLHPKNILGDRAGGVTLVDTDSFQFYHDGRLFRCFGGKGEYLPRELHGAPLDGIVRTVEQDAYALAICLFQLLMNGHHPFVARWQGTGRRPSINERIVAGVWPYAVPGPQLWLPPHNAPPLAALPAPLQNAFSRCFQDGHDCPNRRPTVEEWVEILWELMPEAA